jgi:hypothetical protein
MTDYVYDKAIFVEFSLSKFNQKQRVEIIPQTQGGFLTRSVITGFDIQTTSYGALDADDMANFIVAQRTALKKVRTLNKKYVGGELRRY